MTKVKEIMKTEQPIIVIENFLKKFNRKESIGPISTQVKKGTTTLVVGRSGTGKSVLLNSLMGSYTKYKGKIYMNGYKRKSLTGYKANSDIGFYTQMDFLTYDIKLKNYMKQIVHLFGIPKSERENRVRELLQYFELDVHLEKKIKDFSWGMKNRLNLVLALIKQPKILILDEPAANLDSVWRKKVIDKIKEYKDSGTTIVIVVHNIDEMIDLADQFFLLDSGKVIFQSSAKNISLYFRTQLTFLTDIENKPEYKKFKAELIKHNFVTFEEDFVNKTLIIGLQKQHFDNINFLVGLLVKHELYLKNMISIPMDYESIYNSIKFSNQIKEFNFYFKSIKFQNFKKLISKLESRHKHMLKEDTPENESSDLKCFIDEVKIRNVNSKYFLELMQGCKEYLFKDKLSFYEKSKMFTAIKHAVMLKKLTVIEEDLLQISISLFLRREQVLKNKDFTKRFNSIDFLLAKYPKFNFPKKYLKVRKINQFELKEHKFLRAYQNILFW